MAYQLQSITVRTKNTDEGINKIDEIWQDIMSGKLPILFDSEQKYNEGISPVAKYDNFESDENGAYDLSIMGVTSDFFIELEKSAAQGYRVKYEEVGDDLGICTKQAWEKVWSDQQNGVIQRAFAEDYERTVPAAYTNDGKVHCYLYILVK